MKIATDNIDGITGRLPALLQGLGESRPDIVCLPELKTEPVSCGVDREVRAREKPSDHPPVWIELAD